ncbi:MAG: DISARM system phospholipase D-like protein DrmC [Bradyrhizobium sp.]|uniref:DISARM system phospholipase D-like protein DrmC n=1 Tax=Bradyrhizobium sp. TaxID=376 RepID=UPI003D14F5B2
MGPLLKAVSELVALLSPSKIEAIASRLRGTAPSELDRGLHQVVGTPAARAALDSLTSTWKQSALPGDVVAGILIGAAHARLQAQRESNVELVWTGPTTPFVATRRTEQVLLDLIQGAKAELFIVSFVAYDVPSVIDAINSAISRGVETRILAEASVTHGGSLLVDPVATMRSCVPSAMLYAWIDRPYPYTSGRVHAKVAVADSNTAFLTSANLTGHALEKNMEAGVFVTGGHIPVSLRAHLHALIETKVVRPV